METKQRPAKSQRLMEYKNAAEQGREWLTGK